MKKLTRRFEDAKIQVGSVVFAKCDGLPPHLYISYSYCTGIVFKGFYRKSTFRSQAQGQRIARPLPGE